MNEQYTPATGRYEAIPYRRVGKSGLQLPAISLGCWHNFGGVGTDSGHHENEAEFHDNCRAMLFTAFDNGITHFDLANNYGPPPGAAEARVGKILCEDFASHRDELVISTKAGFLMWPGPYGDGGSRKYLLSSLDQSLQRLGLEYVDIFYHHRPDGSTPLEETLGALDDAVRSGKALYCGLSNYSGERTREALEICEKNGWVKPIIHQPYYNLLSRDIETDLWPIAREQGIGIIAFCPLAQGVLTGKYLSGVPDDSRAANKHGFLKREQVEEAQIAKAQKLNDIAKQRGQSLAQMALAWTLRDESISSALIGASRPQQIVENVAAAQRLEFGEDELHKIEDVLKS